MTVRRRLLVVSLVTLASGLGVLLVLGNALLGRTVDNLTTQLLHERFEAQVAGLEITATGLRTRLVANDFALDERAWVLSGQAVIERPERREPALDRLAIALGRRARQAEVSGPDAVRLFSEPVHAPGSPATVGVVVVGVSVSPFIQLKHKVLFGSLATAAIILLAAGFAVRRALRGALDPVRRMTDDAEEWGAHDLDRRFDLGAPRDELTGLAATLDHLLERIAASRRHEQRFAGDVAHELRTPLSIVRGRIDLALDSRSTSSEAELRETLGSIRAQADQMSVTIETLLAIARSEIDPQSGTVDLRSIALEFDGIELAVTGGSPVAESDPDTVRRALAPLIDNARKHARARVTVELAAVGDRARVTVRDDGDGIDPQLGEAAFDPGRRGRNEPPGGAGLGLPLARRLARASGGDVTIGPGPGGCFILDLPAAH